MAKSMTGFGRGEFEDEKRRVTAEIRSVNHRYCDINVRMPRRYSFAEESVKNTVKKEIQRGKIDITINVEHIGEPDTELELNMELAGRYMEKYRELVSHFDIDPGVSVEHLASLPDVLRTVPAEEDEDEIISAFTSAVSAAAGAHDSMRTAEGERLADDLRARGDVINGLVKKIEERSPEVVTDYYNRLKEHMHELIGDAAVSEERLIQEAAVFADRINVTEEYVRLHSHVDEMNLILSDKSGPIGKKLDFLVQEMNREANTIGSKANDIEITRSVLLIKSEVEKIREQVQNIE